MGNARNIVLMVGVLWSMSVGAVRFSDEAKRNNQWADSVNRTLTLVFCIDTAHYDIPYDSIRALYAWGSMSEYKDAVASCRMTDFSEDSCFYITFTYDEIARPGDSGQPEFEFYLELIDSTTWYVTPDTVGPCSVDRRLLFYNGITPVLIVLPDGPEYMTTNLDTLYARSLVARAIKPLKDYDLTDSADQHKISNFRLTAGTTNLYRSYHPYYPSLAKRDTEAERLHWVSEMASQAGVRSAISLTGSLAYLEGQSYVCAGDTYTIAIPPYYQSMTDSGNVCNINISSNVCYYHPDEAGFAQCMQQLVTFMIDERHPMPMQIHCAIGADRTGVVCAVVSALCGADWPSIMRDYAATSDMMVQTYRHPNRIRYVFRKMTGLNPDQCTSDELAAAIRSHLVNRMRVLSNEQIDRMVTRLTSSTPTSVLETGSSPRGVNSYDLLGREVDKTYRGLVIEGGALIWRP